MIKLTTNGGISEFQWSTSEKVWPFEKDRNGNTLYAKEIDCGRVPNAGGAQYAHNISGLDNSKVFHLSGSMYSTSQEGSLCLPHCQAGNDGAYTVMVRLVNTNMVEVFTWAGHWYTNNYHAKVRIIYAK